VELNALNSNTTGTNNTASGMLALYSNTTGSNNTVSGYFALRYNTTGGSNTASGANALYSNTTGSNNTASGYQALYANTTGNSNVGLGYNSGGAITTGTGNVVIGGYTGSTAPISTTGSNSIVISDGAANVRQYYDGTNNAWVWKTGASERMRIDSSGNVGIGTSSPTTTLAVAGTLSATGVATFAAGTVALPSITKSGDTNTGVYFPAADTVGITTGGVQRGAFSSTGLAVTGAISASGTLSVNSNNISADNSLGFRNRIINGDMRIDQRNAGASVSATNAVAYTVDRFYSIQAILASKFTIQQSSTAATGFTKSVVLTSSSAYTVLASDYFLYRQVIEGFNVADLGWGAAGAQTITLSFWVRSSLTGTFGGSLSNGGSNRSYPFSYTINTANTYEQKTITIAGDTTGTWATDNSAGIVVNWSLGMGSTYTGTVNTWAGSFLGAPTGSTNLVSTNAATLYITGVQLEVGSVATPFERRPYGTELALCQRYYEKSYDIGTVPGTNTVLGTYYGMYFVQYAVCVTPALRFIVSKRAAPTMLGYTTGGVSGKWEDTTAGEQAVTLTNPSQTGVNYAALASGSAAQYGQWTASAEL
jgi:hypothetical protein